MTRINKYGFKKLILKKSIFKNRIKNSKGWGFFYFFSLNTANIFAPLFLFDISGQKGSESAGMKPHHDLQRKCRLY